jgi:hypothetical protein
MSTTEPLPASLDPRLAPKRSMSVLNEERNVLFTFILLILLFALWGSCTGMIDVRDKTRTAPELIAIGNLRTIPATRIASRCDTIASARDYLWLQ